jgi:hypothetical protein
MAATRAPERTAHTARSIVVELATITAGVLIALSIDSAAEWYHHRALVQEARANITTELRSNRGELDGFLKRIPEMRGQLGKALELVSALEKRQPIGNKLELGINIAQLSRSSLETAQATGAQGFMAYEEVKRYADAYGLQQQFSVLQEQLLEQWIPLLNFSHVGPDNMNDRELGELKTRTLTVMSYLHVQDGVGKGLLEQYDAALAGH